MAEAMMNQKSRGRVVASSAGSRPALRVNPLAIAALREIGIDWAGHEPRSIECVLHDPFDLVITVCDNAKEACPIFPGHPVFAHWVMEDPADVGGSDADKRRAFAQARDLLARRLDELLAELPTPAPPPKFNG
jgi:arsenate reductase (thioredoxin)